MFSIKNSKNSIVLFNFENFWEKSNVSSNSKSDDNFIYTNIYNANNQINNKHFKNLLNYHNYQNNSSQNKNTLTYENYQKYDEYEMRQNFYHSNEKKKNLKLKNQRQNNIYFSKLNLNFNLLKNKTQNKSVLYLLSVLNQKLTESYSDNKIKNSLKFYENLLTTTTMKNNKINKFYYFIRFQNFIYHQRKKGKNSVKLIEQLFNEISKRLNLEDHTIAFELFHIIIYLANETSISNVSLLNRFLRVASTNLVSSQSEYAIFNYQLLDDQLFVELFSPRSISLVINSNNCNKNPTISSHEKLSQTSINGDYFALGNFNTVLLNNVSEISQKRRLHYNVFEITSEISLRVLNPNHKTLFAENLNSISSVSNDELIDYCIKVCCGIPSPVFEIVNNKFTVHDNTNNHFTFQFLKKFTDFGNCFLTFSLIFHLNETSSDKLKLSTNNSVVESFQMALRRILCCFIENLQKVQKSQLQLKKKTTNQNRILFEL